MTFVSRFFYAAGTLVIPVMAWFIAIGFPPEIFGTAVKLKNLRTPFIVMTMLLLAGWLLDPARKSGKTIAETRVIPFLKKPAAMWALFGAYAVFFTWQQVTEYYGIAVNFLPFSFYDYMLYYLFQGKVNYTGLLHTYYHLNNILIPLAPVWVIFKSSLFLTLIYGAIAAFTAVPLYGIGYEKTGDRAVGFFLAFIYLNYRYLQNILLMNFAVEIFYPLFIFGAVYFALKKRWGLYFLMVVLGLNVKEDSFIYFSGIGALVFFLGERLRGIATAALSLGYFVFLTKVFIPLTGNTVFEEDMNNFVKYGSSFEDILINMAKNPLLLLEILFGDPVKWDTYFKVLFRLLFIPLCSPASLLILLSAFPLFCHSTGRDSDFWELRFHYVGPVLPFIMIGFVFGFANLYRKLQSEWRRIFLVVSVPGLLLLNGGNYTTSKINRSTIESIRWARSVPEEANLVTHGHLLPYIGYRKYNYYFAEPFHRPKHKAREAFENADYYLIDLNINLYPMDREYFDRRIAELKQDPRYELIREGADRFLFKRKIQ